VSFDGSPLRQAAPSSHDSGKLLTGVETVHVLFASSPVVAALGFAYRVGGEKA
jgi:hypothetical protein